MKKLDLDFTRGCNLSCIHCFADAHTPMPNELTTAEYRRILEEAAALGTSKVTVGLGGEALTRPDIWEILTHGSNQGHAMVLATNGLLLQPHHFKVLADHHIRVSISLDGATAETHETLRLIPGSFEGALRAIRSCKAAGVKTGINVTLTQHNVHEFPVILDLAEELGLDFMSIGCIMPFGRALANPQLTLTADGYRIVLDTALQRPPMKVPVTSFDPIIDMAFQIPRILTEGKLTLKRCGAGEGNVTVRPNGDVWPCQLLSFSMGNVREKGLAQILEGQGWSDVQKLTKSRYPECPTCNVNKVCKGGCPAAWIMQGERGNLCGAMQSAWKETRIGVPAEAEARVTERLARIRKGKALPMAG